MRKKRFKPDASKKSLVTGVGSACPKCGHQMVRVGHPENWKPRPRQPFWFAYWDKCRKCHHLQHYETAKRYPQRSVEVQSQEKEFERIDPLTQEWRAIVG